jgi:hypothetical protein
MHWLICGHIYTAKIKSATTAPILYCKHERVERSLRNYGAIVSLSQETVQRILAKAPSLYEEEVH